jgi:hypothetical protein
MPLYRVYSDSHDDQERREFHEIIEAAPEEIELKALEAVLEYHSEGDLDIEDISPLRDALANAKKQGETTFKVIDDTGHSYRFALWYYPADTQTPDDYEPKFGFGAIGARDNTTRRKPSEFTDKYENRLVGFYPWRRDEQRYQELLRMEKDELADLICRLEATR